MSDYVPAVPPLDRVVSLETYQDMVDHLTDVFEGETTTDGQRKMRRAIQMAYDEFPSLHKWSYYTRRGMITTIAPQTTGEISYDHTGGTYERQLTLTGATFPTTDLYLYRILINNVQYDIEAYKTPTVATLTATSNPGADISSTSYNLFRSRYPLPLSYRAMATTLVDTGRSWGLNYVDPVDVVVSQITNQFPQQPRMYTIHNTGEAYGNWLVEFIPPPNTPRTWEFVYRAAPRPLRIEKLSAQTLTTNGTTTVTGSGTEWTSSLVGCILRVPVSGTTEPGGRSGGIMDDSIPYDVQRIITDVASNTELTVDTAISARSSVGYTISDPIDVAQGAMLNAFKRQCEAKYAHLARRKDEDKIASLAQRSLVIAKGADYTQEEYQHMGVPSLFDLQRLAPQLPNTSSVIT